MNTSQGLRGTGARGGLWARWINIGLGLWLFISAFAWVHAHGQRTNTSVVALLMIACSLAAAFWASHMRYLNAALAVWLAVSAFALPSFGSATPWNNVLVAIATFFLSLVPGHFPSARVRAPRAT